MVEHLADRGHFGRRERGVPANVLLPWRQSLRSGPNKRAGTFGGFLGPAYDPLWTDFDGEAPLGDPYRAVTHAGRFVVGAGDSPAATPEALTRRQSLLSRLEAGRQQQSEAGRGFDRQRGRAFDLLATNQLANALRIDREPGVLRERYGLTLFGQACLSARRLLEAGVKVVTVVWDEFGKLDESWDTHHDHHERMKGFLLPGFDRAFSALIGDLDSRGLLADTLVLCLSEHGRTPRFYETAAGAPGRDHWSRAYCQLLAGAGVPRGMVIGRTDSIAGDVTDRPVEPKDVLCTAYHLLGIDPRQELIGPLGRRLPLVGGGSAIPEVLQ